MENIVNTVLCVDDNPDVLHVLEVMLRRRGFRVLTATTGESGIELFRSIRCDAAILDYMMPSMKGGELAQKLRAVDPELPIILHTGYGEVEDPLLENVDCTIPKGSFVFLLAKLNELLALQASEDRTGAKKIARKTA